MARQYLKLYRLLKNKILLKSLSLLAGTGDVDTVDKAYCLKVSLLYINFLLRGR